MKTHRRNRTLLCVAAGVLAAGLIAGSAAEALAKKRPKREVPDYDGRGKEPRTAGDVLIWIPRVVVSPLYLVSEFVIRRPLGWLVTTAEKNRWPALVVNFFTFGSEGRTVGLVPTFLVDFGFRPSFGLFFFWRDAGLKGNSLTLRAATGGSQWLTASVADKLTFPEDRGFVKLGFTATRRPDRLFWALGGDSANDRFRYADDVVEGELRTVYKLWRRSSVGIWAGLRTVSFRAGACCADPALDASIDKGVVAEPPGFADGYGIFYYGGYGVLDTRHDGERGSGFVVAGFAEHGASFRRDAEGHFVRYGGAAAAFVDVTGTHRVLGLGFSALFADPLDGQEIPFTELASLGGGAGGDDFTRMTPMRGFLEGRLRDHSAIAATLDYEWPIWIFLSGYLRLEVGNVFGTHLQGFSFGDLRLSFGGGIRTSELGDNPFDLMFAFGTERFRDGGSVESFRFVIGTSRGF